MHSALSDESDADADSLTDTMPSVVSKFIHDADNAPLTLWARLRFVMQDLCK